MTGDTIKTGADYRQIKLGFEDVLGGRARSLTQQALAGEPDRAAMAALTGTIVQYLEGAVTEVKKHNPPPSPLACAAGCDHCCHNLISTTPPQIFGIADELRATLSPERLDTLRAELAATLATRDAQGHEEWSLSRPRCALLRDGGCLAYEVRPAGCRGWNSFNAEACEADLKRTTGATISISFYLPQAKIATCIQDGMLLGLDDVGAQAEMVELTAGLAVALSGPDLAERWLTGEPVFADAHPPADIS